MVSETDDAGVCLQDISDEYFCMAVLSSHLPPSISFHLRQNCFNTFVILRKYIMKLLVSQFNHCEVMRLDYISVFGLYFSALEKGLLV